MTVQNSPIVIGAGHNGLTAAFYLAQAGLRPVVLEARTSPGGAAVTETLWDGVSCPALAHAVGPLRPSVVRDMQLARRGVEFLHPDPRLTVLTPEGRALPFSRDTTRTTEAIRGFSAKDATRYPDFCGTMLRLGRFLAPLLENTPPSLEVDKPQDVWGLLKMGRRFRALGRTDAYRLLRWMPMPVADLVGEWFETDALQAAIGARGIFGTVQGPWSAGTAAVILLQAAIDPAPGGSSITVRGGPGALIRAMADAAREAGADIRIDAPVSRILVSEGRAAGVVLRNGTEVRGTAVISSTDPRRTFLELVDAADLDPEFQTRIRNYRSRGAAAKVNLALRGLPSFNGVSNPADLSGRIQIGPTIDYLERAFDASKYGEVSSEPYLDITIPTLQDPSLAPAGRHIMSIYMQFAPYRLADDADWDDARQTLGNCVMRALEPYAPNIRDLVEHEQVITPLDMERTYGLTGGHIFHGEPALDQLFTMRPVLGWAQYRTPIAGLFMCGSGTHPGGGITGGSGQNAAREILGDLKTLARNV